MKDIFENKFIVFANDSECLSDGSIGGGGCPECDDW